MVSRAILNWPKANVPPSLQQAKPRLWALAATAALALASTNAHAQATGFSGSYALGHWHSSFTGAGSTFGGASVSPNPTGLFTSVDSIDITGPHTASGYFDFTITATAAGIWSFHYDFRTLNSSGYEAGYDLYFGSTVLRNKLVDTGSLVSSDTFSIDIVANSLGELPTIGFYVRAQVLSSQLTHFIISNLTGPGAPPPPSNVPEPTSLWLLAAGTFGASMARKRKLSLVR